MKAEIEKIFDDHLREKFKATPEIVRFLIGHERKGICLENLCGQIEICERRQFNIGFNSKVYKRTIQDIGDMFASACLKHAEELALSSSERLRRITEGDKDKSIDEMVEEWKKDGAIVELDRTKALGEDDKAETQN